MDLSGYKSRQHRPEASLLTRSLWYVINAAVFDSWLVPSSAVKRILLNLFGGDIRKGVVIKPRVNIKYPWKLSVGEHSWIGEGTWIDNLDVVRIGAHCCISQGVYLCTGNHDWSDVRFGLATKPITIADHSWIGAFTMVCPGALISEGTVIMVGSLVRKGTDPWTIYSGSPAVPVRKRDLVVPNPDRSTRLSKVWNPSP
jgi:putative colanic acid biosynthesis acetyltransferase WcaF